ncbi:hypothetical protein H8D73_00115 [bacterium]|nr:hypothetical protein [bacterium]
MSRFGVVSRATIALVAVVLMATVSWAADWRSLPPSGSVSGTRITVESRALTYYRFDSDEALTFVVAGPTRVKILTRLSISNGLVDTDEEGAPSDARVATHGYSVEIYRDGALTETKELATESAGEKAYYVALTAFTPGKIRRIYIDVPTGTHSYSLRAVGRAMIDARIFESTARTPKRVSIAPREYGAVEMLLHREKELTYYIASGSSPVVLDVVGPTTVKVNTRLLFSGSMFGEQVYMLGIQSGEGEEIVYRLESQASQTVVCRDREDVLPGALRSFELPVPRGRYSIVLSLLEPEDGELALKFYIPRGDIANEP